MKGAIITGASGFIGKSVCLNLISKGIPVLAIDIIQNSDELFDNKLITYLKLDINDIGELSSKILFGCYDTFYHFAWIGSSGHLRADPNIQMKNIKWTIDCVYAAKKCGCTRFVGAGSIMEDEAKEYIELDECHPSSGYIYSTSKLTSHYMSKIVSVEENIDHVWGKISNTYGPGETSPRLINTTIRKLLNNEPLNFTSGDQLYDFIYIDDLAESFYMIGNEGKSFTCYYLGTRNIKPLRLYLEKIRDIVKPDIKMNFGALDFEGISLKSEHMDVTNLLADTSYKEHVTFEDGIKRTYNWIKESGWI